MNIVIRSLFADSSYFHCFILFVFIHHNLILYPSFRHFPMYSLFFMQMQIKLSDMMTDVAANNEEVTSQVEDITSKLESLESKVLHLPDLLAETVKSELSKLNKERIPRRRKRSRSLKQKKKERIRQSTTASESCSNSLENPLISKPLLESDRFSDAHNPQTTSRGDKSVT